MLLKNYQKKAINSLEKYLQCLEKNHNLKNTWREFWQNENLGLELPKYNDKIKGVPNICIKIPTGGGKTFLSCASIKYISNIIAKEMQNIFIIWLVPSDSIREQTLNNLKNVSHPYRMKLNSDFNYSVAIFDSNDLLNRFNIINLAKINIAVLSFASIRINNKELRKMYQENGALLNFNNIIKDGENLEDADALSVINVIRNHNPIVVIDESHNATSNLSLEMLKNLNPRFIFELTATPKESSNIIHYANVNELKKENMVKLPVFLYNCVSIDNAISYALKIRADLEQEARNKKIPVRPIVLLQAQSNNKENSETFDKIKNKLVNIGIPKEQIAIKTANINELKNIDLLSKNCEIRYIITINALKEGWDCPFAYVLVSLANKSSKIDVEQIIGRILRQPYTKRYENNSLNASYVFTSSYDFSFTAENVIKGLNKAGFSEKNYRQKNYIEEKNEDISQKITTSPALISEDDENDEFITAEIKIDENIDTEKIFKEVKEIEEEIYKDSENNAETANFKGAFMSKIKFDNLPKLPQFVMVSTVPSLNLEEVKEVFLLDSENLDKNFELSKSDRQIDFGNSEAEAGIIDLDKDEILKYTLLNNSQKEYFKRKFENIDEKSKPVQIGIYSEAILKKINKYDSIGDKELKKYITEIIKNMTDEQRKNIEKPEYCAIYADKIKNKIDFLLKENREKEFYKFLEIGRIKLESTFEFKSEIMANSMSNIRIKTLYEKELDKLNYFEKNVIDKVIICDNVKWWHRNFSYPSGFCINGGFLNHYPDFIICTNKDVIIILETKGDDRDNSDSILKAKLGKKWADMAGEKFKYFMVFESKSIENSHTIDEFIQILKNIE